MSPSILTVGPYRFYFFSNEPPRPNIHCGRDSDACKWWLEENGCPDVSLKDAGGILAKGTKRH